MRHQGRDFLYISYFNPCNHLIGEEKPLSSFCVMGKLRQLTTWLMSHWQKAMGFGFAVAIFSVVSIHKMLR